MGVFEQYPVASWKVGSLPTLKFPVCSISEDGGNRIVERERPYRDGAKLDDTGSKAKKWVLEVKFENSIAEEGLDLSTPLYPTIINQLIASFDIHETGDLVVPTRGMVRAKADSYRRREVDEIRDYASVSFTFCEDNEDNVGNQAFEQLNVNASARRLGEQTVFSATSEGVWTGSLADFNEFMSELEGISVGQGDVVADIDSQVAIVIGGANRFSRAVSREADENRNMLNDPELSLTQRKLEESKDMAGRSKAESYKGLPKPVPYFAAGNTDLFTIAAALKQLPEDVISINPNQDPLFVPKGTVVNVLETA